MASGGFEGVSIEIFLMNQFSEKKIRNDFFCRMQEEYVNENNCNGWSYDTLNDCYKIQIEEYYGRDKKEICIKNDEQLTPYRYFVDYDMYDNISFQVLVAIGKFKKPDVNVLKEVEKGIAKLYYNSDFELYSWDMFYDLDYEPKP